MGLALRRPAVTGWFMAFNETTLARTSVLNVTPNGYDGANWMSGGGLAADSSGFIYALDGNGIFDSSLNAGNFPSKGDYGNAFLKLELGRPHRVRLL